MSKADLAIMREPTRAYKVCLATSAQLDSSLPRFVSDAESLFQAVNQSIDFERFSEEAKRTD